MSTLTTAATRLPNPHSESLLMWVDFAKGIGIVLVVVGHTIRGLSDTQAAVPGTVLADAWIYSFHMPLFFYLSGLFLEHSCRRVGLPGGLPDFVASKTRRILWPYLLWSVIQEILRSLAGVSKGSLLEFWRISFQPVMQFWFLYVLFAITVAYAIWRKAGLPWHGFVIAALGLHVAINLGLPLGSWGIPYQIAIYSPYTALGVMASQCGNILDPGGRPLAALATAAIGGYAAVLAAAMLGWGGKPGAILPVAAAGIGASVALGSILSHTAGMGWLGYLGRYSLEIFVAHTIFSATLRQALFAIDIHSPGIHLAGGIAAGLAGPLALVWICRRARFRYLFEWPQTPKPPGI